MLKNSKRFLALVLAGSMLLSNVPVQKAEAATGIRASEESSVTEEGVSYQFDAETGTIVKATVTEVNAAIRIPEEIDGVPVKAIGMQAFVEQTNLKTLTIPSCVESIGENAFGACLGLTSVVMESEEIEDADGMKTIQGVSEIGANVFMQCTSLQQVILPGSLEVIPENTFRECRSLTDVTIPEGVLRTGHLSFYLCESLETITFPDGFEEVGDQSFYQCDNLTTVNFGTGLKKIGLMAFRDCPQLVNFNTTGGVKLPDGLTELGESTFYECDSLKGLVTIPGTLKEISKSAFHETGITEVILEEGVETIGERAFYQTALTEVTIPDSVTTIGNSAFRNAEQLQTAVIGTGVTEISEAAFFCAGLEQVTLPDTLVTVGANAFCSTKLTSLRLPQSVKTIGKEAFAYISTWDGGLTIPEGTEEIGELAFANGNFTSLVLPETLQTIQNKAFQYCNQLESVDIPESVTEIGDQAFEGTWMFEVYLRNPQTEIGTDAFKDQHTGCIIYGYAGSTAQSCAQKYGYTFISMDPTIALTGFVQNQEGEPIANASVTATVNQTGMSYTVQTDANGSYVLENIPALSVQLKVSKEGYFGSFESLELKEMTGEYLVETVVLSEMTEEKIVLEILRYEVCEIPEEAVGSRASSAQALNIKVEDAAGNEITGYEIQGTVIRFYEGVVGANQEITVWAEDPAGVYFPSEKVTVTLDAQKTGKAVLEMRQKGAIQLGELKGVGGILMLFDSDENLVTAEAAVSAKKLTELTEGDYTVVLMEKTGLLRSVSNRKELDDLGLTEGEDYVTVKAAVRNGMLTVLSEITVPVLDRSKISYVDEKGTSVRSEKTSLSPGEMFSLKISYQIAADKDTEAESVRLKLPEGFESAGGVVLLNEISAEYQYNSNERTVHISTENHEEAAEIYLYLQAGSTAGEFDIPVYLNLKGGLSQPLGSVKETVEKAQLQAPERTATETFIISGTTLADSDVMIYEDGVLIGTTKANRIGEWSARVTLAETLYDYSYHWIYGEISSDQVEGTIITEEALVIYDSRAVMVETLTMYSTGFGGPQTVEIDYRENTTKTPYYMYSDEYPDYRFEVKLAEGSDDLAENLCVYSVDHYGDTTYVPLTYDKGKGLWTGTHRYSDVNEIPAMLGVAYDYQECMLPEVPEETIAEWNGTAEEMTAICFEGTQELMESLLEENYESVYDEESSTGAVMAQGSDDNALYTYRLETESLSDFSVEAAGESGYFPLDEEEKQWARIGKFEADQMTYQFVDLTEELSYVYTMDWGSKAAAAEDLEEGPGDWITPEDAAEELIGMGEDFLNDYRESQIEDPKWLSVINKIMDGTESLLDYKDSLDSFSDLVNGHCDEMWRVVDQLTAMIYELCPDGSPKYSQETIDNALSMQAGLIRQIKEYQSAFKATAVLMGISTACSTITAALSDKALKGAGETGEDLADIGEKLWGWLYDRKVWEAQNGAYRRFALMQSDAEVIRNYLAMNMIDGSMGCDDPEPKNPLPSKPLIGLPDPSGYVYEAVPSNRLEGVTAEIFYQAEDGSAVSWNAEAYSQVNAQITGENGNYRWDVPFGNWKVMFEKAGYESTSTVQSERSDEEGWLTVPPIQLEVNIEMVSKEAPKVKKVTGAGGRVEIWFDQYMDISSTDGKNVLHGISAKKDGADTEIQITALNAEYNMAGTIQYASGFAVIPKEGSAIGTWEIRVDGAAENYVKTPMGQSFVSESVMVTDGEEAPPEETEFVEPVTVWLLNGTPITNGREVMAGAQLRLKTATEGAQIRYTLNNTCPCKEEALYYEEPITVTEDVLVRAAAVKDGVYSETIRINLTVKEPTAFLDVPENEYYTKAVLWAVANGITTGYTAERFAPAMPCTRAQVVTFLWRVCGSPKPEITAHHFTDLDSREYYYEAVLWAIEKGITSGYTATTFEPEMTVTREQFVTFLYRAQGKPAYLAENPFRDVVKGEFYYDAVLWAVEHGVTTGLMPQEFGTYQECIREQVVTFLHRAY